MKILVISLDFPPMPGGIAIFVHNLCLALCERKNQVVALVPGSENSKVKNYDAFDLAQPYRVHRFKQNRVLSSFVPTIKTLIHIIRFRPDILILGHVISIHGFGALVAKKVLGIPYLVLSHGDDLGHLDAGSVDHWATHKILTNASLILANSTYTKQLIEKRGYNNKRIFVLNPGVDIKLFNPKCDLKDITAKYRFENKRIMLSVGRLMPIKNHCAVIKALPQVLGIVPNLIYMIIGDGPEKEKLKNCAIQNEIDSQVYFIGEIPHRSLPAFYCRSDIFILPSKPMPDKRESFGIAFIEASACELPVIGGRNGGISDAVVDGKTGLLVDPHSINEIAEAIIRLLTNKELALKLGLNGRRRVEEKFDWTKVGERLENYLKQVLKTK